MLPRLPALKRTTQITVLTHVYLAIGFVQPGGLPVSSWGALVLQVGSTARNMVVRESSRAAKHSSWRRGKTGGAARGPAMQLFTFKVPLRRSC